MTKNIPIARRLRQSQTDAERMLWLRLRDRRLAGWKFKRQVPIDRFVVDFCCADGKLVIELDGGQHSIQVAQDAERTQALSAMGYLVLRFWNNDVLTNIEGVLGEILLTLPKTTPIPPHPDPLPDGERE
ncbi:endonuclease domain-containing protein [Nitrobacter sp.]|uniref:endonuclease domain-containing protein n=1 Tax=unclassified Nitrobacter TaxID=2620411 RepID=UPI0032200A39